MRFSEIPDLVNLPKVADVGRLALFKPPILVLISQTLVLALLNLTK